MTVSGKVKRQHLIIGHDPMASCGKSGHVQFDSEKKNGFFLKLISNNCKRNNLTTYFRYAFSIAQIYTDRPYCLALHASVSISVYIHVPGKFLKRCDI